MISVSGTTTTRRRLFIAGWIIWMVGAVIGLDIVGILSPQVFFITVFLGYLLLVELTTSNYLADPWRGWLTWPERLGYAVFLIFVARYVYGVVRPVLG